MACLRLAVWLCLACGMFLAACSEPPPDRRYRNTQYKFSFVPPEGWKLFEEKSGKCLVSAGAKLNEDVQFYVCVSAPPEGVFNTKNPALNCEQLKLYLASELLAQNAECRTSTMVRRTVYDVMYKRWLQKGGKVRTQFVNQVYLLNEGLVYTLTFFAVDDDELKAKELFEKHLDSMLKAGASFWLHTGSMEPPDLPGGEYRR